MKQSSFTVVQMGARMHYAVPRILSTAGVLAHLYTDFSAASGWPRMLNWIPDALRPVPVRRLLGRTPKGIPHLQVTAFNAFGLEYARRLRRARSVSDSTEAFLWAGRKFCNLVMAHGFGNASGIYTFNSAGLELLQHAKKEGRNAVMEQTIAPKRIEEQLLAWERESFPDWEPTQGRDVHVQEYMEREEAEWHASDRILCGSDFVREGIAKCGGPVEKCAVVPYGVDVRELKAGSRKQRASGPLRVLTVGAVGLRKGSPYVLEAARRMRGAATFRMVGGIGVSPETQSKLSEHVELLGSVPRSSIHEHFAWADVFLLPSICEGSATVAYEALAHGLPVLCTPNTGSVVREGLDGFIVPARDVDAIVQKIEALRSQPELLINLSTNARARAAQFTVAEYGQRLLAALPPPC